MSALSFEITCRRCGADVTLITQSGPKMTPERRAVVECTSRRCGYRFLLRLELFAA